VSDFSLDKIKDLPMPEQSIGEWRAYLEFIETYFKNREIENPMIVEIGVDTNTQKRFYEELLGYRHIGIDKNRKTGADIIGDCRDPAIVDKLKGKLGGEPVNLIFIDGEHSYLGVKKDYELYSPLAKNIIVLHDVILKEYENTVGKFWRELMEENKKAQDKTFITLGGWHNKRFGQGTGIILIENTEEEFNGNPN